MEENNLISAPQFFGPAHVDTALFVLLTEATAEREEYLATHAEIRQGAGGYCPTVYL